MSIVKIEVYSRMSAGGGGCSCGCSGCTPSDVKAEFDAMKNKMVEQFGAETLEIDYIDTEGLTLVQYPEVEKVANAGYPFPITVVNGKPRWAGGMPTDSISQIIVEVINQK
jgi:hypothetical protein